MIMRAVRVDGCSREEGIGRFVVGVKSATIGMFQEGHLSSGRENYFEIAVILFGTVERLRPHQFVYHDGQIDGHSYDAEG